LQKYITGIVSGFRDEYTELLEQFGVEFDSRYIFKTPDE